jgi:gamma-glutamyltranspeptidase/glutathione hydrolase
VLEGLGILEHTAIGSHRNDAEGWYLFSQASRLMYADRDRYVADPDFIEVPTEGLLDPAYLAERAKLIGPMADARAPAPGRPKGGRRPRARRHRRARRHHALRHRRPLGDVVSMTTTVESTFGSGRMVDGFFLNNQLTDFSLSATDRDGVPAANAVAGGKRPRSSMSPAIVLDRQHRFVAAIGSPGGPSIVAYTLKGLVGLIDWKLPVQDAINLPNMDRRRDLLRRRGRQVLAGAAAGLAAKGVRLQSGFGAEASGLHGIEVTPQGLRGGADPRREGVARQP